MRWRRTIFGKDVDLVLGIERMGFIFWSGAGVSAECGICSGAQSRGSCLLPRRA